MPPPYLLHPAAVHAPLAILPLGLAAALAINRRAPAWLGQAASWLLWLGTASAWAALGLGLLAERTVPHIPMAWETLAEHEELAWWTVGIFTVLSGWRFRAPRRARPAFLALWLAGCGVLLATAFHGGELVFSQGVGVRGGR